MIGKMVSGYTVTISDETNQVPIILANRNESYVTAQLQPEWNIWKQVHRFKSKSDAKEDFDRRVRRGY